MYCDVVIEILSGQSMCKTSPISNRLEAELKVQLAAVDEGIRAADAGRVVSHAQVAAWVASWGCPDELPMPKIDN
jgi:predicted transcriptional regulator